MTKCSFLYKKKWLPGSGACFLYIYSYSTNFKKYLRRPCFPTNHHGLKLSHTGSTRTHFFTVIWKLTTHIWSKIFLKLSLKQYKANSCMYPNTLKIFRRLDIERMLPMKFHPKCLSIYRRELIEAKSYDTHARKDSRTTNNLLRHKLVWLLASGAKQWPVRIVKSVSYVNVRLVCFEWSWSNCGKMRFARIWAMFSLSSCFHKLT